MKIISDREFRNAPGKIRKELAKQNNVVMTQSRKPYAVLLPIEDSERVEDVLELADRVKAQMALSSVRQKSQNAGLDTIDREDIDREIEQVRKQRQGS